MAKSAFKDSFLLTLVKPEKYSTESVEPVNGINKDMNDATLLPKTVSTYPVD